jgi:hypothetical protein
MAVSALRSSAAASSARLGARHAHAAADAHLGGAELDGLPQRLDDAPRDHEHVVAALRVVDEHGELVAAEPRHGVAAARGVEEPLGGDLEQPVARLVPHRVVDLLEVVEVAEDGRHALAVLAGRVERAGHALGEQHAVGEPGERVVVRLVGELALERLALGDVVGHADDGHLRPERLDARDGERRPAHLAVVAHEAALDGRAAPPPGEDLAEQRGHHAAVLVGRRQVARAAAEQLVGGVAEQAHGTRG